MVTGGDGGECESGAARGARGPEPAAPPRRQPQRPLTLPAGRPAWLDYLRQRHPGRVWKRVCGRLSPEACPRPAKARHKGSNPLVWFPVPMRTGSNRDGVWFAAGSPAKDQLPPIAKLRLCLAWSSVSPAQSKEEECK